MSIFYIFGDVGSQNPKLSNATFNAIKESNKKPGIDLKGAVA
jgi:hypothetical protein